MIKALKLELAKVNMGSAFRLDFIVDGVALIEKFPLRDFDDTPEGQPFDEKWAILYRQGLFATRLGWGSADWQSRALRQLLLLDPPELLCGRRRLYTCPLCDCGHLACRIRLQDEFYVWEDFIRGSPTGDNAMEGWKNGRWERVEFPPIAAPAKEFKLHADPMHFDQQDYESLFEPLLAKLQPRTEVL